MSSPASPPWTGGSASRDRADTSDRDLRVSDAERAEVADRLSRHYGDGRLDQAEFEERLGRAMKAKTRADFDGLFADLPDDVPPEPPPAGQAHRTAHPGQPGQAGSPRRPPWPRRHRILFLALVVLIAATAGQAFVHLYLPWLAIAVLAFILLRAAPGRSRR